ncbi:hypothetical protein Tco_0116432 [Tanacetum coccineum]
MYKDSRSLLSSRTLLLMGEVGDSDGDGGFAFSIMKNGIRVEEKHCLTTLVKSAAEVVVAMVEKEGVGGGEVNGGRVDLRVVKSCLGENPCGAIREVGGDSRGVEGGAD